MKKQWQETIENNIRKVIIDEQAVNPEALMVRCRNSLIALIELRRTQAIEYQEYLKKVKELAWQVTQPGGVDGKGISCNDRHGGQEISL